MSTLLADVIAELGLKPGQTYTKTVGDRVVKLSIEDAAKPAAPEEEPSQFADMVMLEPWFEMPPPTKVGTVTARLGTLPPMDPVIIDEWDRTQE